MKTLLLVDGHALIHRAYFAIPPFKTKDGFPTNAIYGFFMILQKSINDFKPHYLVILYDTPKPTFRNKLYKNYQIHRPKSQDNMIIQIPKLKEILNKGKIFQLEKEGFEADDLIGTITTSENKNDLKKIILTGDKDIFQLVNENTFVMTPQIGFSKGLLFDKEEVIKKLKVQPIQIPDYKALAGDPSDNYPGAKGIGPKTAEKLINEFISIENLYQNLDKVNDLRIKKLLNDHKDDILLSKKLAVIVKNIDINFKLSDTEFLGFNQNVKKELLSLGMNTLVKRLFTNNLDKKDNSENKKKNNGESQQASLF
ncbi:hypothetical protein A3F29_04095 [Candidatus Roizmanbacteria bacterium RIFCSPHIGHO2_12_FULL_33_9]|uniref:5'-3' exonuclease domain-containing protein n=1 Tax=Candidatus Roizmanbacteria bacterium RIFCSPHIGHO2_12_FULL_33_9 TaxID=1802045 RepID=A0A1F7HJT4_9BACT|nr:MAG: hypothetical protein A3F29_04095 [Candidatus Roizmanbacteria bacterium RIFCSPHIGHO2_12_FULL_33_9]